MVQMVEGIMDKLSEKWEKQETEHNAHVDLLIELQRDRLKMEQEALQFQKELAGLKVKVSGEYCFFFSMADQLCMCTVYSVCSYHLHWLFFYPGKHQL